MSSPLPCFATYLIVSTTLVFWDFQSKACNQLHQSEVIACESVPAQLPRSKCWCSTWLWATAWFKTAEYLIDSMKHNTPNGLISCHYNWIKKCKCKQMWLINSFVVLWPQISTNVWWVCFFLLNPNLAARTNLPPLPPAAAAYTEVSWNSRIWSASLPLWGITFRLAQM